MKILFLDDNPVRWEQFRKNYPSAVWVQTATECIAKLSEQWDMIFLDHDLGGDVYVDSSIENCGMEVVRYLYKNFQEHLQYTQFIVHSYNTPAAFSMVDSIREAGYSVIYKPFAVFGD